MATKKKQAEKPTREVVRQQSVNRYKRYIKRAIADRDNPTELMITAAATGCVVSNELYSRLAEIISDKNRGGLERALDIQKLLEDEDEWFDPASQIMGLIDG